MKAVKVGTQTKSMQDLLKAREACMADEIAAADKKQHDEELTKGIIALVFALILCVMVFIMVRQLFRKPKL